MKKILSFILCLWSITTYAQLVGGSGNGLSPGAEVKASEINSGGISGDVNVFSGTYSTSYNLGSVSTISGLNYSLGLSYGSTFLSGGNTPLSSGMPYGEGWSLGVPMISVSTENYNKYTLYQMKEIGNNNTTLDKTQLYYDETNSSCEEAETEGRVFWFSPNLSIPGVASGRMVYKEKDEDGYLFVLNHFERYIEARFNGNSTWEVIVDDGTRYVFDAKIIAQRQASNQRVEDVCTDESNGPSASKANLVLPKSEILSWYCERIYHPNFPGDIHLEYDKYGPFNFFEKYQEPSIGGFVVNQKILGLTSNGKPYLGSQDTTYRDIILKRIYSDTEELILDYKNILETYIDPNDGANLLVPGVNDATALDDLYTQKAIRKWGGNEPCYDELGKWDRFLHPKTSGVQSDPCDPLLKYTVNRTNPYQAYHSIAGIPDPQVYVKEPASVDQDGGNIPFKHGYLQSPRIAGFNAIPDEVMPAGDIYQIKTEIRNNLNSDKTFLFDINLATGDNDASLFEAQYNGKTLVGASCYTRTTKESVYSTFNEAIKWRSDYDGSPLSTSNFFVMPNLPNQFDGFHIQIGPANSDMDFAESLCPSGQNTYPVADVCNAYFPSIYVGDNNVPSHNSSYIMESGAAAPSNFGVGVPWFMLKNNYGLSMDYCGSDPPHFWWNDEDPNSLCPSPYCTWENKPTRAFYDGGSDGIFLGQVEVVRYAKNPYMLNLVTKRVLNESGNWVPVQSIGLRYEMEVVPRHVNTESGPESSPTLTSYLKDDRNIFLLKKIRQLPAGETDFIAAPTAPTTHFGYDLNGYWELYGNCDPIAGCDGVYYNTDFPLLESIVDPLGKVTQLEYHPLPDDVDDNDSSFSIAFFKTIPGIRYDSEFSPSQSNIYCGGLDAKRMQDPSYSFQVNFKVKTKTVTDRNQDKSWSYQYGPIVIYDDSTPFNDQFAWDVQYDMQIGHSQTTVSGPSATPGGGPKSVYDFYTSPDGLFGKVQNIDVKTAGGDLVSNQTFTYESVLAFDAPWVNMNQGSIDHPDMVPFDDMFEAPFFYETRYASEIPAAQLNSYFIKKTLESNTVFDNGGAIATYTEYEYYDADANLNTSSSGFGIMGIPSTLNEQPSWQLYRKRTSSHLTSAFVEEEYFYLYDLVNHPNHQLGVGMVADLRSAFKMRNILFEIRTTKKGIEDEAITQSVYNTYTQSWPGSPISSHIYQKQSAVQVQAGSSQILTMSGAGLTPNFPYETLITSTINTRNDLGQVTSQTDHKGLTNEATYNSVGLLNSHIKGVGEDFPLPTSYEYFDNNTVKSITDPNGILLEYTYDDYLRLENTSRNGELIQSAAYSNWANDFTLPFTDRASQNSVSSTTYVTPDKTWSETSYVDPLGRKAADVKGGVLLYNPVYDIHNRPVLTLKPMGGGGPNYDYNFPNQDHAEAIFDVAPRSRPVKTSKFGESISGDHIVETEYEILYVAEMATQYLSPAGNNAVPGGFYFLKTKTTDEDGKEVIQFTNQLGQLAATLTNNGSIATVLKYDSHGNVKEIHNPKEQVSTYSYNYLGQLFEEETPDGGLKNFGYNPSGQLIAESHANNQNRVFNYDKFGRVKIQVKVLSVATVTTNEGMAWVGNPGFDSDLNQLVNGPKAKKEKQWFYNTYDESQTGDYQANAISYLDNSLTNAIGQLVQTSSYDPGGNIIEHFFISYTDDGFTKWEMIQLKKPEDRLIRIDYRDHNLLGSPFKQDVDLNGDASLDFQYRYLYDDWNRVEEVYANYDDPDGDNGNKIVRYEYNNIKGVVENRYYYDSSNPDMDGNIPKTCRNLEVDHTTMSYDDRIRLTQINSGLFDYTLFYDDQVNSGHTAGSTLNFNGNVNGILASYNLGLAENGNDADMMEGATNYNYTYDNLNRLITAEALVEAYGLGISNVEDWGDSNFAYDKVGNFTTVNRGLLDVQTILFDTYTYTYLSGNNRLDYVTDSNGAIRNIGYDNNGNMTSDSKNNLTVGYDRANLPTGTSKTQNGNLSTGAYLYDANDNRIVKEVIDNNTTKTEFYIRTLSGQDIAVYQFEENKMTWYVHGNERVAKIEQQGPVPFTPLGGDTPDVCDPNPPECDPQEYYAQQNALPSLRAYMANRDGNQMSLPQTLQRIRLCDGTEMNILDDELSLLPGNYTTLQSITIHHLSQTMTLEGSGQKMQVNFVGYLLGRGYDERIYINGYQPCIVRGDCDLAEAYLAKSVGPSTIYSTYLNNPVPYGDLTALNPGSNESLVADGVSWHINTFDFPNNFAGEAEWDISISLPGNAELTDFYLTVEIPGISLNEGVCRMGLYDGNNMVKINGGLEDLYVTQAQTLIIKPDGMPSIDDLNNYKLAIYYDAPGFFVDIDFVRVNIEYTMPCACIAPPPVCPGNTPIDQQNTLDDLRNHIDQVNINDITFPTKIYRTRYCDGSEINVIREEMSIPMGGGLVLQRIPISNANEMLDVRMSDGTDVTMTFAQVIDIRKTNEGIALRKFCTEDDDGDPYDDPLDENEPETLDMSFYLYDHLGNTRVLFSTDFECGDPIKYYIENAVDYYPYGKVLREFHRDDKEKYLTTYHERDEESDLDYRGARFYDSDLGRFLSLDPLAVQFPAWSDYNYVLGNPVLLVDNNGKIPEPPKFSISLTYKIEKLQISSGRFVYNGSTAVKSTPVWLNYGGTPGENTRWVDAGGFELNIPVKLVNGNLELNSAGDKIGSSNKNDTGDNTFKLLEGDTDSRAVFRPDTPNGESGITGVLSHAFGTDDIDLGTLSIGVGPVGYEHNIPGGSGTSTGKAVEGITINYFKATNSISVILHTTAKEASNFDNTFKIGGTLYRITKTLTLSDGGVPGRNPPKEMNLRGTIMMESQNEINNEP